MSGKSAAVFLSEGVEELEMLTPVDILRRAKVDVTVVGVPECGPRRGSIGTVICPDKSITDVRSNDFDVIVIPGGRGGYKNLSQSEDVKNMLQKQESRGGIIAAICHGPLVLKNFGIYKNKKVAPHPITKNEFVSSDYHYDDVSRVVVDDGLITSRSPGTAMDFSFAIVEKLFGKQVRDNLSKELIYT